MMLLRDHEPAPWPAGYCQPPEENLAQLLALEPGQEARFVQADLAAALSDWAGDWTNALLDAVPGADEGAWALTVDLSWWGVAFFRRYSRAACNLRRDIYWPRAILRT